MGDTQAGDKGGANAGASPRSKGDLVVIREQVLENGDLLRQNTTLLQRLIELVLPKATRTASRCTSFCPCWSLSNARRICWSSRCRPAWTPSWTMSSARTGQG